LSEGENQFLVQAGHLALCAIDKRSRDDKKLAANPNPNRKSKRAKTTNSKKRKSIGGAGRGRQAKSGSGRA